MTADFANEPDPDNDREQTSITKPDDEKAALLIEKLRLDNEEQRARISQLQLKWWQKPIGLLAMILPLVPLMATGAVAIADKWSEQQQREATVAKKAAEVEKEGYETENKRLALVKQETELENSRLLFHQDQLRKDQAELESRVRELSTAEQKLVTDIFNRYVDVCEIGGRIVTANDIDAAEDEYAKFDAYKILGIDATIAGPLGQINEALVKWRNSDQRPDRELERFVLGLSMACKRGFQQFEGEQFDEPIRILTMAIYEDAENMIRKLEKAIDFEDAESTIDRFWELYYGKLVLVESRGVEAAMVRAGAALKAWTDGPPDRKLLKELSDTFRKEFQELMKSQTSPNGRLSP